MSDERDMNTEPAADPVLRAALVDAFGEQPSDLDWSAMQRRIRSASVFRLRAMARVAPWWEQVTPWVSRLLPAGALAAAAALALAMVTPRDSTESSVATASYASESRDPIADAVAAPNGTGAVGRVGGPVDDDWLWNATAAAHATEDR
jgi:hypothetical protein